MKVAFSLKSEPNSMGLHSIFLLVREGEKKKRISANLQVKKEHFDSSGKNLQWVNKGDKNYKAINAQLLELYQEYSNEVTKAKNKNLLAAPDQIAKKVNTAERATFFSAYLDEKRSEENMPNYNQRKGYDVLASHWAEFTTTKKVEPLNMKVTEYNTFKHILNTIKRFETFLFQDKKQASSTVYSNLKRVRALWNLAISEQLIPASDYIFSAYTMPKSESIEQKERLTKEELKEFLKQNYEPASLIKNVQQAFFLSFNLGGARIEDLLTLTWDNVSEDRIVYQMKKGDSYKTVSVKITPAIKGCLDYFWSVNHTAATVLGLFDAKLLKYKHSKVVAQNEEYKKEIGKKTSLYNKYLKLIATDACIAKSMASHVARHTFAQISVANTGGDVVFLKEALNHSSIKITQNYLASLEKTVLDDKMGVATAL